MELWLSISASMTVNRVCKKLKDAKKMQALRGRKESQDDPLWPYIGSQRVTHSITLLAEAEDHRVLGRMVTSRRSH